MLLDSSLLDAAAMLPVAEAVLAGGATVLQLRAKHWPVRQEIALVQQLVPMAHAHNVPLLVNDHVDVALATGADGVHLGSTDFPVGLARQIMPDRLIGYSPDSLADAQIAVQEGADYLGVGPFAATTTKGDAGAPIGSDGLSAFVKAIPIPIVAIGGINADNAAEAMAAGAAGIAVVSAVIGASNPMEAARHLRSIVGRQPSP